MECAGKKISITTWDDKLSEAAGQLFASEYGGSVKEHVDRFSATYDHDFQKGKSLRIVAMKGEELVGIQSLFYWPYKREGETFNVLQSGNSIIAPSCRGMGVFGRMLEAQDVFLRERKDVDWVIGFPVAASRNSFIRNGWHRMDDLSWRLAVINPLSWAIRKPLIEIEQFLSEHCGVSPLSDQYSDKFRIVDSKGFQEWRESVRTDREFMVVISVDQHLLKFRLKVEVRKKIPFIIVGDVSSSSCDSGVIRRGFRKLFLLCRKAGGACMAVCYNPAALTAVNAVITQSFPFKLKNRIHCILKPVRLNINNLTESSSWVLYRADVDTW